MSNFHRLILAGALLIAAPAVAEDMPHPSDRAPAAPSTAMPMPGGQGMMGMGMGATGMMGMMGMMGGGTMPRMGQAMAPEHIEGRIALLATELKITEAQRPLWDAFAEALRANARIMAGMMRDMGGMMMMPAPDAAPSSLPQRLEAHEAMLAARLEALRNLKAKLQSLYAAFDDTQRRTADQLLLPGPMELI